MAKSQKDVFVSVNNVSVTRLDCGLIPSSQDESAESRKDWGR
jgi:hypothetical protein